MNFLDLLLTDERADERGMSSTPPDSALWYIRCPDCLAVGATPGPRGNYACELYGARCQDCGGQLEVMGRVSGSVLIHGERCPCDERCTSARGPKCDCSCGGKNHGAGLRVYIPHVAGEVPKVRLPGAGDVRRVQAFRARWEAIREKLAADPTYRAKCENRWVADFGRYLEVRRALDELRRIRTLRTHDARDKALDRLERR